MMILLYPTRQILSKGEISDFRFQHFRLMSGINDTITPQPRFVRKREREGGWGERVSGRKRARKREWALERGSERQGWIDTQSHETVFLLALVFVAEQLVVLVHAVD